MLAILISIIIITSHDVLGDRCLEFFQVYDVLADSHPLPHLYTHPIINHNGYSLNV